MEVKIERISDTGDGIGNIDGKVVFIPKTIPGDIVSVKNIMDYKRYMIGEVDKYIDYSKDRVVIKCPYYDLCGGCQIMSLDYDYQLEYKKNKVITMFKKYANINVNPKIVGTNSFGYRNKVILEVLNGKLGLFKHHSHDIINIDSCLLLSDKINDIIRLINDKTDLSLVKKVMLRISTDNKVMICFDGKIDNVDILKDKVSSIYVNSKLVYGEDKLRVNIGKYIFEVSNKSFFQVNYEQMERLYNKIYEYLSENGNVLDLYCGTGSIGCYVSSKSKSVLGVEINKEAIEDAKKNKMINNISNIYFKCGDVENIISSDDKYDSVIVDPPRAGLSMKTKNKLLNISSKEIIYVSCDPMTLVRDIKYLSDKYFVKDITLFDMFPNTYHVETVMVLEKKDV